LDGLAAEAMEQKLSQKIGERARQLFEESGNTPGNDKENWLRAESEILGAGLEVRESGSWVIVNASLPNLAAQDIRVAVRPTRIVLCAQEMDNPEARSESMAEQPREIFLAANLPAEVDPASAAGSFRDRHLDLMAKKQPAK
jgi:HSP20 family molecular chaperone IbpA